jgi:hypothetical protein
MSKQLSEWSSYRLLHVTVALARLAMNIGHEHSSYDYHLRSGRFVRNLVFQRNVPCFSGITDHLSLLCQDYAS